MANSIKIFDKADDLFTELDRVLNPNQNKPKHHNLSADGEEWYVDNAPIAKNNVLVIKALAYDDSIETAKQSQLDAAQRQKEYETFKKEAENFVKKHAVQDIDHPYVENVEADSYSDMKGKFQKYLEGTPKHHSPNNITLLFLGHGNVDGAGYARLCFGIGELKWPLVNDAFYELHEIHEKSGIKSSLKIVFTQCYSHKHNIATKGDAKPGLYCEPSGLCDSKFMFLASDKKEKTTSRLRAPSQPKSSSGPILIGNDLFVDHNVGINILLTFSEKLRTYIENTFQITFELKDCINWFVKGNVPKLISGNQQHIDDIEKEIDNLKKKIKSYLHIAIGKPEYSEKAADSVLCHLEDHHKGYSFKDDNVTSFDTLKNKMIEFVKSCSVEIPIIFISGFKRKDEWVFSENEYASTAAILTITNSYPAVRVTFFGENVAEDTVDGATSDRISIYSENVAKLEYAEHLELTGAIQEILGLPKQASLT